RPLDRGEPAGVRHVSHPDAVSGHAAVSADGGGGPYPAPELDALRHGACRLPAEAHDAGTTRPRVRLVLSPAVLARLDLAPPAGRRPGRAAVPGDVLLVQALELAVVPADSSPADGAGVARAGRDDAPAASEVSAAVGGRGAAGTTAVSMRGVGGCVSASRKASSQPLSRWGKGEEL